MTTTDTEQTSVMAPPQKKHEWLQQLVGEWTVEGEMLMEAGQPPEKYQGTESVRSLGGYWTVAEGRGEIDPGFPSGTGNPNAPQTSQNHNADDPMPVLQCP